MFFMKQQENKGDVFNLVQQMVRELLLFECPEHRSHHHILFTLNMNKHRFTEQLESLQTMHIVFSHLQQLAMETRQHIQAKVSQFEHLEKAYLLTVDETQKPKLLHALAFEKERIEQLHDFYTTQREVYATLARQLAFYEAIKVELLPILVKLHY